MLGNKSENVDMLGILCSSACALHCSLPSILLLLSPNLSTNFQNEFIHLALLVLVLPISTYSFYRSYRQYQRLKPVFFGLLGVSLLLAAVLGEHFFHAEFLEKALTFLGSTLMVCAHLFNIKLSRAAVVSPLDSE